MADRGEVEDVRRQLQAMVNSFNMLVARVDRLEFIADLAAIDPLDDGEPDPPESEQERLWREDDERADRTNRRLERD